MDGPFQGRSHSCFCRSNQFRMMAVAGSSDQAADMARYFAASQRL